MSNLPKKCVVDTNVPITANLATNPAAIPDELAPCVLECVKSVEHVIKNGGLVLDAGGEIFAEYHGCGIHRGHLSLQGQPGVGDQFVKWVHDHQWNPSHCDRIAITKKGDSYDEFPHHDGLSQFDNSDRKFIAVANAHQGKPPVLQATDSKWWGWKDALEEMGITVRFVCPEYARQKHKEKMGA
ncbi:MAG: hypothetical protein V2A77_05155 [Pseudomonadota bacterium]